MDTDEYNTLQNLIDLFFNFFTYYENRKKQKFNDANDKMFWIGYNFHMVINYTEFLCKRVPKKITYILDIKLHDTTPDPYLYSILFKNQTILKTLQAQIPTFFEPYKAYLDVEIFKIIRQDLIYFYDNYGTIKSREDLLYQHIEDGHNFLTRSLPDNDDIKFIDFLKGKEKSSRRRQSRSSNRSNGAWRTVSSKKSKSKRSTIARRLQKLMRITRKRI